MHTLCDRRLVLAISVSSVDQTLVLRCEGRLVSGVAADKLLLTAMSQPAGLLVLDLSKVNAIDAAGIGALIQLTTWSDAEGRTLKLLNPTRAVRQLLRLFALDIFLPIARDEQLTARNRSVEGS